MHFRRVVRRSAWGSSGHSSGRQWTQAAAQQCSHVTVGEPPAPTALMISVTRHCRSYPLLSTVTFNAESLTTQAGKFYLIQYTLSFLSFLICLAYLHTLLLSRHDLASQPIPFPHQRPPTKTKSAIVLLLRTYNAELYRAGVGSLRRRR